MDILSRIQNVCIFFDSVQLLETKKGNCYLGFCKHRLKALVYVVLRTCSMPLASRFYDEFEMSVSILW